MGDFDHPMIVRLFTRPWTIVDKEAILHLVGDWCRDLLQMRDPRSGQCAFSATSVGIRFLDSISPIILNRVRQVDLYEDRTSIAYAPSHAQGLIPFCRANQRLHIQQKVNVWTTGYLLGTNWSDGAIPTTLAADDITYSISRRVLFLNSCQQYITF